MTGEIHKFRFRAMASACEVVIGAVPEVRAQVLAAAAQAEVERIERKYSRYRDDSVVTRINGKAGLDAVKIDGETVELLRTADKLYQASGGLFDITSGVLRRVWRFQDARVPVFSAIADLLPLVDWTAVERGADSVRLPSVGMELDFGGFGKEYAADRAARVLQQAGIASGYVNLGGDLRVVGPKPDGEPWMIGIQHPRDPQRMIASIPVTQGSLATSGDYERYFEHDGKRYCHVLNPRTGFPVQHWQSVSVLAPNTITAGSFSTIAMLLEKDGLEFLQQARLPFLAIDQKGDIRQDMPDVTDTLLKAS